MNVIGINGSPRKKFNTHTLLEKTMEGAKIHGANTEIINLYDLNYKGCISCFACKLKDGRSYGKCIVKDDLKPVLEKIDRADVLILGSPIYLGNLTGEMKSFMERLIFQYLAYDESHQSLFKRVLPTAIIYTMNVTDEMLEMIGYKESLKPNEDFLKRTFGMSESLLVNDTFQFTDYSKYDVSLFDPELKAKRHKEVFPQDCQKAFEMGSRLVKTAIELN